MNYRSLAIVAMTLLVGTASAQAETIKKTHKKTSKKTHLLQKVSQKVAPKAASKTAGGGSSGKLQREVVFDGSTVGGQYHSAGEAVAKVEQEKKMNDLIGMRRDFKDRLAAEKERLQRGDAAVAN